MWFNSWRLPERSAHWQRLSVEKWRQSALAKLLEIIDIIKLALALYKKMGHRRAMELLAAKNLSIEDAKKLIVKMFACANDAPIQQEPTRGDETNLEMRWTAGNYSVIAHIRRLHEKSDGKITGRLSIESTFPFGDKILYEEIFNFTSERAKTGLVNKLADKLAVLDHDEWSKLVTAMCHEAWEWLRKGNPAKEISPDDIRESKWIIDPLIPDMQPTIFFGPPQMGKSYLLQAMILSMYAPDAQDAFNVVEPRRTLYLDWETDRGNFTERMAKLAKGAGIDLPKVVYLRCARPLALDIDKIKDVVLENDIGIVFIDSLGLAAGNDLNTAEAANTFFAAARSLNLPLVIAAHCAKNSERPSVYGSVFFQALARNIYEVTSYPGNDPGELYVTLKHRKNNNGALQPLQAFRFTFIPAIESDTVMFARDDVRNIPEAAPQRPLKDRIKELLLDAASPLSTQEIAENLGAPVSTVKVRLSEMRKNGAVVRFPGHTWGVRTDDVVPF